jgi:methionyl-tRNA synthetase
VPERIYLTTAIDYPMGRPHVGNALEKIGADTLARYHRMCGRETRLLLGSDEHTILVPRMAAAAGQRTEAFVDDRVGQARAAWKALRIEPDDFIRTSDPRHEQGVRAFVQGVFDEGLLYRRKHESLYCENCEEFKAPEELRDGCCAYHLNLRARAVKEENWFFPLSAFRGRLLDLYGSRPDFIRPERVFAEVVARVERGLEDIPMTREHPGWGITAPFDSSQTIYVWVDALLSYITAIGYVTDENRFRAWWPAEMQIVGRDIAAFHGILWPALLLAAGLEPPRRIEVHGLVRHRGEKMSKTIGNVVDALDVVDRHGVDALRYFLLRACPFRGDGDFAEERLDEMKRRDLDHALGSLLAAASGGVPGGDVLGASDTLVRELHMHIGRCEFDLALERIFSEVVHPAAELAAAGRLDPEHAAAALRAAAIFLRPFVPDTAQRLYAALRLPSDLESLRLEDAVSAGLV